MKDELTTELFEIICKEVFIRGDEELINHRNDPDGWLFDFRRTLMNGKNSDIITDLFYDRFKDKYPFQLCALEVAGIPVLTSIVNKLYNKGFKDINGFFIRKSRKKDGLNRMIEGTIEETKNIILVDDILNSGESFKRQITVLEKLGYSVSAIWSVLQYRDTDYYTYFTEKGIDIHHIFTLDDFTAALGENVCNRVQKKNSKTEDLFNPLWAFHAKNPNYNHVVVKSQPLIDEGRIYVGSDRGTFYCLSQKDGSVVWQYQTNHHNKQKGIFSSPAIYGDIVIFGAYDGNIYGLDKATGKKIWVNMQADWVGSSPDINHKQGIVYIGLEFGVLKKKGGVIAIDCQAGETIWADYSHDAFTHASPLYIKEKDMVIIGSNEGVLRAYNAQTGEKLWDTQLSPTSKYSWKKHFGFGPCSIKMSPAYWTAGRSVIVSTTNGSVYIINIDEGNITKEITNSGISNWGTPLVFKDSLIWTSLDKNVYCFDLVTMSFKWKICPDNTRIFSSPTVINNFLYIGTNAARLHKIDLQTGELRGYFQATERITNKPIYNSKTQTFFVPTFANEIIALKER